MAPLHLLSVRLFNTLTLLFVMVRVVPAPGVKGLPLSDALVVRSEVIVRFRLEALEINSVARGTLWRDQFPLISADGKVDFSTSVIPH